MRMVRWKPQSEKERYQLLFASKSGEITVTLVDKSEHQLGQPLSKVVEELRGFTNCEVSKRNEGPSDLFP